MIASDSDLSEVQRALNAFVDQVLAAVGAAGKSGLATNKLVQKHSDTLRIVGDRLLAVTFANVALLASLQEYVDLGRVRMAAQAGLKGRAPEGSEAPQMLDDLFGVIRAASDPAREPDDGAASSALH